MMEVNIHEAKTHFSRLLQKVALGEEITIAHSGVPVARLVPVKLPPAPRKLGQYQGRIWIAPDFDAPNPEIEAMFAAKYETGNKIRSTRRRRRR